MNIFRVLLCFVANENYLKCVGFSTIKINQYNILLIEWKKSK